MRSLIDQKLSRRGVLALLSAGCLAGLRGFSPVLAAEPKAGKQRPKWPAVEQLVRKHFAEQKNYQPGDLISRSQAEPVFKKLTDLGWSVPDQAAIVASLPADSDFIVRATRSEQGRKFMRSIASYPDAFDRLDRFSRLPDGESSIHTLIKGPGGDQLINFLTSKDSRPQAATLLENSPEGRNFDQPTGRIYTAEALVDRLEQSYTGKAPSAKSRSRQQQSGPVRRPAGRY
jgi:hypothetical protein